MSDLNLRGVDPDLIKRLKVRAAEKDMTLRDYCVMVLDYGSEVRQVMVPTERPTLLVAQPKPTRDYVENPAWEADDYSQ